jgi:hypothetical protein
MGWQFWIMAIVILHILLGFAWFIWKLEFQGKKNKKDDVDQSVEKADTD